MATPSIAIIPSAYKEGVLAAVLPAPVYGEELVVNGDFDTDSDWVNVAGWEISEGKANGIIGGGSTYLSQTNVVEAGKTYKISYQVSNYVSGQARIFFSAQEAISEIITANGTYSQTYEAVSTTSVSLKNQSGLFNGSIDNVSVKEVIAGSADLDVTRGSTATRVNSKGLIEDIQVLSEDLVTNGDFATDTDWSKGLGWTISNGSANCDGTQTEPTNLQQVISTNIQNKLVRVSFTLDYTAGVLLGSLAGTGEVDFSNITSSGTYTVDVTSNEVNPTLTLQGDADFIGSISNVVVKIVTNDTNIPRLDYSDGSCPSLLLEPQSTNLLTYSEDFSQWNKGLSTTISPNYAISPDGTQNATRIQTPMGIGTYLSLAASMTIGSIYTLALYLKNNGGENIDIGVSTSSSVGAKTASIEVNLTNEWVRYELSFTADSNSNFVFIDNINNANAIDCLVWGAQLEEQSYATSYIPNYGTAEGITRLADFASKTGLESYINSSEGVLYAEIKSLQNTGPSKYIALSDGTFSNRISVMFSVGTNILRTFLRVGGVSQSDKSTTNYDITNYNKIAFSYKENEFKMFVNGIQILTPDTSGITFSANTLSILSFSEIGSTGGKFEGNCKDLRVYKTALSDFELAGITSPILYPSFNTMATELNFNLI